MVYEGLAKPESCSKMKCHLAHSLTGVPINMDHHMALPAHFLVT